MEAADERKGTQFTILYLLQEASKSTAPIQNGFPDTKSSFTWPESESSVQTLCHIDINHPFATVTPHPHSSPIVPCGGSPAISESEQSIGSIIQPSSPYISPWDAMCQINLQCERLLNSRETEECDFSNSTNPSLHSIPDTVIENSRESSWRINSVASSDSAYVKPGYNDSLDPITSIASPGPDVTDTVSHHSEGSNPISVHHSAVSERDNDDHREAYTRSSKEAEEVEKSSKKMAEVRERNCNGHTISIGHQEVPVCRLKHFASSTFELKMDESFEVGDSLLTMDDDGPSRFKPSKENGVDCVSAERHGLLEEPDFEDGYPETTATSAAIFPPLFERPGPHAAEKAWDVPFGHPDHTTQHLSIQSQPSVTLDFNPDLTVEPQHEEPFRHPSQTVMQVSKGDPGPQGLAEQGFGTAASDVLHTPRSETGPHTVADSVTDTSNAPTRCVDEVSAHTACSLQLQSPSEGPGWKTKTPRKQCHPRRSVTDCDPHFQGVAFRMHTELGDGMEHCRLLITSKYSEELCKNGRRTMGRLRSSQSSFKTSSSDEESDPNLFKKECASCSTKKTPLWRDAEDGTPLCNACGIRYKKYRVRCANCWHIPRKEGNSSTLCYRCGELLRLSTTQRRYASAAVVTYV